MNTPRKHHFVPKVYLKGFTNDGRLSLYDKDEDRFLPPSSLSNIFTKRDLYSCVQDDELFTDVETVVLCSVEGQFEQEMKHVNNGDFHLINNYYMTQFIGFLLARGMETIRTLEEKINQEMVDFVRERARISPDYKKMIIEYGVEIDSPSDFTIWQGLKYSGSKGLALSRFMMEAQSWNRLLCDEYSYNYYESHHDYFVTSDSPVVFVDSSGNQILSDSFNDIEEFKFRRGIKILLPLSETVALEMIPKEKSSERMELFSIGRNGVSKVNEAVFNQSNRFVVFGCDEYLKKVVGSVA